MVRNVFLFVLYFKVCVQNTHTNTNTNNDLCLSLLSSHLHDHLLVLHSLLVEVLQSDVHLKKRKTCVHTLQVRTRTRTRVIAHT